MFCAISGTVPEQPCISTKSGHLFERRLVEKYVKETGKCPVTQESLSLDDLMPLKVEKSVKPRPSPATSVPGLLGLFHDEWDAVMLETHSLRTSLNTVRQELSHALYQHDAACRVIARLMKERDEARSALADVRAALKAEEEAAKRAADEAEREEAAKRQKKAEAIPDEVMAELMATNAALSKTRKKRAVPDSLATIEELSASGLLSVHPLHKTTAPGISQLELSPEPSSGAVATGGLDGTVQVFDVPAGRVLSSIDAHSKRVTGLSWVSPSCMVTTSTDKSCRIWRSSGEEGAAWECSATLRDHGDNAVVGVTLHPSRKFFVTAGNDSSWAFYDLACAQLLKQVRDPSVGQDAPVYSAVQYHPDGLILGTGTEKGTVRIWELRELKNVANFEGHGGALRGLGFSENGYHLATVSDDCVKLWDLRKLKNFKTLEPYEGGGCHSAAFDHSGMYLAVGGPDARIYAQKQDWSVVKAYSDLPRKGSVMAMKFGADARSLYVGAGDHNLRVFGLSGGAAMQE